MRFRKGNKVEVLNKRELPYGSWNVAEILSGNGHTYCVRYDHHLPEIGSRTERVPRKAIRPFPPPMQGTRSWVSNDIVEVLEGNSWKPAEVSRVVDGGDYLFVTLLGSSREFRVHVSELRLRQAWEDDEWVVLGKESRKGNDAMLILSEIGKFSQCHPVVKKCRGDGKFLGKSDNCFMETYQHPSSGMKKRRHFSSPHIETHCETGRKTLATKKKGKRQRLALAHSSRLPGKVDSVASPQIKIGEKYMHASLNNNMTELPELGTAWGNLADETIFFSVGSLEVSDSESLSSSVGSSSPSYGPYRSSNHPNALPAQDTDLPFDDETPSGSGGKPSPAKDGLQSELHQLELNAYHSTMVALYASGPLSWEREDLLTNLRLMLHITNDEHLLELRHLASIKSDSA
ncbi:uncharacterized protein M6B38_392450 [Iris pallida]|uniref:ENT domain-containing protein n=1 Tax=Iris pallida TaxID=29817 RepID=A0AAX6FLA4_IRIPA|nr:uncharacterized protein M6B38_413400 [Iris pallida]KAJ6821476.1 uncharacterized protein M6B38_392450 [Iris pallida]